MIEKLQLDFDKITKTLDISKKEIDLKRNYLEKFIESGFPNKNKKIGNF